MKSRRSAGEPSILQKIFESCLLLCYVQLLCYILVSWSPKHFSQTYTGERRNDDKFAIQGCHYRRYV